MATYLLNWNPEKWHWDENDLAAEAERCRNGTVVEGRWSSGNRTSVELGARFFLLPQGAHGRGTIAGGEITSDVFSDDHFDEERADRGEQANYVNIKFHWLINPLKHPEQRLDAERLLATGLTKGALYSQASGTKIPDQIGQRIEGLAREVFETDSLDDEEFMEGDLRIRWHKFRERNAEAIRKKKEEAIKMQGKLICEVCKLDFEKTYGWRGEFIAECHHGKRYLSA
jgi:hypothetical protein